MIFTWTFLNPLNHFTEEIQLMQLRALQVLYKLIQSSNQKEVWFIFSAWQNGTKKDKAERTCFLLGNACIVQQQMAKKWAWEHTHTHTVYKALLKDIFLELTLSIVYFFFHVPRGSSSRIEKVSNFKSNSCSRGAVYMFMWLCLSKWVTLSSHDRQLSLSQTLTLQKERALRTGW